MDEREIVGQGAMSRVWVLRDTIRRERGEHSGAVAPLPRHLERRGCPFSPRHLGVDDSGRDILSRLPGEPVPTLRGDEQLDEVGSLLRALHDAVADFHPDPPVRWRDGGGAAGPGEIVIHGDVAPWNLLEQEGHGTGLVDFDSARPGRPVEDFAYTAWHLVPLHAEAMGDGTPGPPDDERPHRLSVLLDALPTRPRRSPRAALRGRRHGGDAGGGGGRRGAAGRHVAATSLARGALHRRHRPLAAPARPAPRSALHRPSLRPHAPELGGISADAIGTMFPTWIRARAVREVAKLCGMSLRFPFLRTIPVAHRGAHGPGRRENSAEAISHAIALGAPGVEFDVSRLPDGDLVAWHSHCIVPGGEAEPVDPGEPQPVEDVLEVIGAAYDVCCVFDWKGMGEENRIERLLRRHRLLDRTLVSSVYPPALTDLRREVPGLVTGLSFPASVWGSTPDLAETMLLMLRECGANAAMLDLRLARPELARMLRNRGYGVFLWTAADGDAYADALPIPADGVMTDAIDEVMAALRPVGARR